MAFTFFAFAVLISALIIKRFSISISNAHFIKKHGCKPQRKLPQFERIIGYGLYRTQVNAAKEKTLLEGNHKRFQDNGITWSCVLMGKTFYNTIDPENIQVILATNFHDFGVGERLDAFGPLLGRGIFTEDGAEWAHSRVSLHLPTFLSDLLLPSELIKRLVAKSVELIELPRRKEC
jgi:hypothetical protein